MTDYMVEFTITGDPNSQEFQTLVPPERTRIGELLVDGDIKGIWLKADYSGGYFIANVEDEVELNKLFASLPLLPFLSFEFHVLKAKK